MTTQLLLLTQKKYLGFSKTSHAYILDRSGRSVVDKVEIYIYVFFKQGYHSKENNMKIQYAN